MAKPELNSQSKDCGGTEVIKGFELPNEHREFVVFVGPSCCEKSTLLRMIAGLEEISGGEFWIGDRMVNDIEPRDRGIAMVFQSYALARGEAVQFGVDAAKALLFGADGCTMPAAQD